MKPAIRKIYNILDRYYGDLGWWPAETVFEVIIGAVLTQNTSWKNVEKAVKELKKNNIITLGSILSISEEKLSGIIRSSGYHRVKARRLKNISVFFMDITGGDLDAVKEYDTCTLREKLLGISGIGPETADSILLYAFDRPVFVVDAYTRRIFHRHGILSGNISYDDIQDMVHKNFYKTVKKFNQFHAVIVETAKRFCRKNNPLCDACPLRSLLK